LKPADSPGLRRRFDRFLFAPANAAAVGGVRIGLAMLLMYIFRSQQGWQFSGRLDYPFVRDLYTNIFHTNAYWWLYMGLLVLFGLGIRARVVGLLLLPVLAPLALHLHSIAGRYIVLCLLLGFVWLRSDSRLSVAALWRPGPPPPAGPMWPIRLMQIQVSLIYAVNAFAKSSPAYLSGDVLMALSMTLPNFLIDASDGYVRVWGLTVPVWLAAPASTAAEWILALGLWFPRWRLAVAIFGVLFHILLKSIVQIGGLDHLSMLLYSLFFIPFERPEAEAPASGPSAGRQSALSS
jgi:hypothetical protein